MTIIPITDLLSRELEHLLRNSGCTHVEVIAERQCTDFGDRERIVRRIDTGYLIYEESSAGLIYGEDDDEYTAATQGMMAGTPWAARFRDQHEIEVTPEMEVPVTIGEVCEALGMRGGTGRLTFSIVGAPPLQEVLAMPDPLRRC